MNYLKLAQRYAVLTDPDRAEATTATYMPLES